MINSFNASQFVADANEFFNPDNLFYLANKFIVLLISPELQKEIILARIIFLSFSIVFLILIVYFLSTCDFIQAHFLWKLVEIITYKSYGARKYEKEWGKIKAFLDKGTEDAYKIAIIEGDNFMDQILKRLNIPGKNIDERLKNTTAGQIQNIDDLREVHKLRNNVVSDPSITIDFDKAKETLGVYEKTLKLLDLL
ncbi:MAG: hypothetical protein Q8O39_01395 [bacterium]|nr:hypothetical protein [bacterium]